jgi:hypothetical protein
MLHIHGVAQIEIKVNGVYRKRVSLDHEEERRHIGNDIKPCENEDGIHFIYNKLVHLLS